MTDTVLNPVSNFYENFQFPSGITVMFFNSYTEILKASKNVTSNCIMINTNKEKLERTLIIDLNIPKYITFIMILNLTLFNKSKAIFKGSNYTVANLSFESVISDHIYSNDVICDVYAEWFKLVNFNIENISCANETLDYLKVHSENGFQLHNSVFNGKSNNGSFLSILNPNNCKIENSVFFNHNVDEMIRFGDTQNLKKDTFGIINKCYFYNCKNPSNTISINRSVNSISNCIFEDCEAFLHINDTLRNTISDCYFSNSTILVSGMKHFFRNIQFINNAKLILKENAKRNSFLQMFYFNSTTLNVNDSQQNFIDSFNEKLQFEKETLLTQTINDLTLLSPNPPLQEEDKVIILIPEGMEGGIEQIEEKRTLSSFKLITDSNVEMIYDPFIISPSTKFNIEYLKEDPIQPVQFFLINIDNKVVLAEEENEKPYYLYGKDGDCMNFSSIPRKGEYLLQVGIDYVTIQVKDLNDIQRNS
jgi:hypothetical protein